MRSTCDRSGGNERADASHFLYKEGDDVNVTLDVQAPGVLYFVRYNHTKGAGLSWVPIGFSQCVSNGLFPHFLRDRLLHLPSIRRWRETCCAPLRYGTVKHAEADAKALDLVSCTGSDLAPAGTDGIREQSGRIQLPANQTISVWTDAHGPPIAYPVAVANSN